MARIDLTPMQSQYVDPGYGKVAEVLRERYDKTLEKKSLLDRAYSQIQVGKGDEWLVNNAKSKGEDILQQYSEEGNWESGSATLAIDDATNSLLSNRGLQVAQVSYQTRQQELEFINTERAKGNNIWDFGSGEFDQHQSYTQDEKGNWAENPYQVRNELELDYNQEMGSIVQNFGKDIYSTETYIDDVYNTYVQSQVGNQDFRRLVNIQLKQAFPEASPEELMDMAESNIKERLRSFSRQAEYESTVGELNGSGATQTSQSYTFKNSDAGDPNKSSFESSSNYLILSQGSDATKEEREAALSELMQTRESTYLETATNTGNMAAYNEYQNLYNIYEAEAGAEGTNRYLQLFEAVNLLTSQTNESIVPVDYSNITGDAVSGAATGWALGSVTGLALGAGTGPGAVVASPVLGLGFGAAGAILGLAGGTLGGTIQEIIKQFEGSNNVRDWERSQEGADWYNPVSWFVDSESEQLMDEMTKLESLNKMMPDANWTEADIPKMQELAKAMYIFKTEKGGDQLDASWKNDGSYTTAEGNRFSASPEGAKARAAFNKALVGTNPEASFMLNLKGPTIKKDIIDNWGKSTSITAAFMADPLRNIPSRMEIQYRDEDGVTQHTVVRNKLNTVSNKPSGWTMDIAQSMGNYSYAENESIQLRLQSLKSKYLYEDSGKKLDIRAYMNARESVLSARLGTDGASEQISRELDQMVIAEIYQDPSLTTGKVVNTPEGDIFIGGPSMLRDNQGVKEFLDTTKNEWIPLDGGTMYRFQELYVQEVTALSRNVLNDDSINGYY